jgi:hypothetical protein
MRHSRDGTETRVGTVVGVANKVEMPGWYAARRLQLSRETKSVPIYFTLQLETITRMRPPTRSTRSVRPNTINNARRSRGAPGPPSSHPVAPPSEATSTPPKPKPKSKLQSTIATAHATTADAKVDPGTSTRRACACHQPDMSCLPRLATQPLLSSRTGTRVTLNLFLLLVQARRRARSYWESRRAPDTACRATNSRCSMRPSDVTRTRRARRKRSSVRISTCEQNSRNSFLGDA